MSSERAERFAEGKLDPDRLEPGERAIAALVHKSVVAPARLEPGDLDPLIAAYGVSGALELVAVLGSFHFINRIADFVGIQSDQPLVQPRWGWVRRLGVRIQARFMRRMIDLSNRRVEVDVDAALAEAREVLGPLSPGWEATRLAPNVAGFLTTVTPVVRALPAAMVERVSAAVAEALPAEEEHVRGFHPRPSDPLEALAFVGTRYVVRTTDAMIDAVRGKYGYGPPALTDLFYAISMRNAFERMDRLLARAPRG